jgi:crotonobetainyl-CoA:carnitine CoA-transferase CaiB-like acyl-CoA transferase
MVVKVADHRAGEIPLVANPIKYSRTPIVYTLAPPALGTSTDDILENDLAYSESQIKALRDKSII